MQPIPVNGYLLVFMLQGQNHVTYYIMILSPSNLALLLFHGLSLLLFQSLITMITVFKDASSRNSLQKSITVPRFPWNAHSNFSAFSIITSYTCMLVNLFITTTYQNSATFILELRHCLELHMLTWNVSLIYRRINMTSRPCLNAVAFSTYHG